MQDKINLNGISAEELVRKYGSPLYVYNGDLIRQRYREVVSSIKYPKTRMLYACKANTNPEIMKILLEEGCGIDAVSYGEVLLALNTGFKPENILFTGNNIDDEEMKKVISKKIMVNIDSISQLERYGQLIPGSKISVRINPDVGAGHHNHVVTGGPDSKFGIYYNRAEEIKKIVIKYNLKVTGLHMHVGSRFLDSKPFLKAMETLLEIAEQFKELDFIDFGGGLGVPYSPDENSIDLKDFGEQVSNLFSNWCNRYGREIEMVFENGRYYVAEAGHLLVRVNTIKSTPKFKFAGVDSGFNHLIRPTMYGSYHKIVNLSNTEGEKEKIVVAGNLCESGDVFTRNEQESVPRELPKIREGDILSIENAGAYGFSMSSNYNLRLKPAEVLITGKNIRLIRRRETYEDIFRSLEKQQ